MRTVRQKLLSRCLAGFSALGFAGSVALFVEALEESNRPTTSGGFIAASVVLFMLATALVASWAAWGSRLRQIAAAVGAGISTGPPHGTVRLSAPDAQINEPRAWGRVIRQHPGPIVAYLALICIEVAGVVVVAHGGAISAAIVGTVMGLDFVALIVWPVIAPARYLKPSDVEAISSFVPGSRVWISTTTAGMKAYAARYFESIAAPDKRLKTAGYVALTGRGIQFWQRERQDLILRCEIAREDVSGAVKADVTWTVVVQSGVILSIEKGGDSEFQVPLLLANANPSRKSPAADEFLAAWAASGH